MKIKKLLLSLVLLGCFILSAINAPVNAQTTSGLELIVNNGVLEWHTGWEEMTLVLNITSPVNETQVVTFKEGVLPTYVMVDLIDGTYFFTLAGIPQQDYILLEEGSFSENGREVVVDGLSDQETYLWNGSFVILNGSLSLPTTNLDVDITDNIVMDQVVADDMIVQYSLCVGYDCVNGESFGFDTIRLKENNLRIRFYDTSASTGFPTNDWEITINDSASGGLNYFAINDIDGGKRPFLIEAGARTNALYVASSGRVGLGTNNPSEDLHILYGDTPTIRLDQQGSGWSPQIWDIAGNEANFFIRDVTNGSKLPFRIRPGAPSYSLTIQSSGYVGIGTDSPKAQLDVNGDANIDGNLVLEGYLSEKSDINAKENFAVVSGSEVLEKLADLPITTWNYINDSETKHIGPMAQDFYGAFEVGLDDKHISALDVNGVALVSIQELNKIVEEKDAEITELKSDLTSMEARLSALEAGTTNQTNQWGLALACGLCGVLVGALVINKRK